MSRARDLADGTFSGGFAADSPTLVVDATNNRVGVGTASPHSLLNVQGSSTTGGVLTLENSNTALLDDNTVGAIDFYSNDISTNASGVRAEIAAKAGSTSGATYLTFSNTVSADTTLVERVRIDSSGNLLVGTTNADPSFGTTAGSSLQPSGQTHHSSSGTALVLNRTASDGTIVQFRRGGSTVGSISTEASGNQFQFNAVGVNAYVGITWSNEAEAIYFLDTHMRPGTNKDNVYDIGRIDARFDDIYATNGTIQTSDRNEKQDIEALSDAEQRVAVAAKGLLRKYRWKDAVAEKGDAARIHFGIIAQDLQAAFEAEGLDAGRYGMFISSTWWEADRVIPAVEAQDAVYETQLDEDNNEVQVLVSEAIEAQPERVVTDTFETLEEAPEGAVQRTRLGVRYPELLAFIIAAL